VGSEKKGTAGKDDILVPLTSSLYVRGKLADREKVLVDVGTGFYVEKVCGVFLQVRCLRAKFALLQQTAPKAIEFYEEKVKGLETNCVELEKIVQTKSGQLRLFEDGKYQCLASSLVRTNWLF
jgi:prefoldin alpha subunit